MGKKHVLFTGAGIGLLVTAPLLASLYLAEQAAGMPFPPFDLFDWIARILPGDVITKGIDTMVALIDKLNLGETSSTAKTLETLMALAMFLGGGIFAGIVLVAVLDRLNRPLTGFARYVPGLITGALLGLPMILISRHVNVVADAPESVSVMWLALAFLTWGAALSWAHVRLRDAKTARTGVVASQPPQAEQVSRRQFLIRVGGATAAITVVGAGLGRYLEYREDKNYQDLIAKRRAAALPAGLPNQGADVEPAPGTRPEYTPLDEHYRIDINVRPPEISEDGWRLRITGLVDRPLTLTLDDLYGRYEPMDQYVTLACISNPIGGDLTSTTRWTGASLQDVLADAGVKDGATHLKITSEDGFFETVAFDLINSDRRIMLTYHWDGIPLLYKHGFPLRIYIPDRYGMKQPKWITEIEVMDHDEDGYWVVRGWDRVAQMRAVSVVDVAASDRTFEAGGVTYVPVGGIAHAGARGISKVEVKVDEGEWVEAQLRQPLSDTTWVIWRYDWPFEAGQHIFRVRCTEGDGTPQIAESNPTKPSGATGIHSLTREL
ncbi:MAG: molybdopterin-dependent oxidoreductase [Anaerolineae bacterium]|nr:molybdopterin-dependent oxidoreductase [Anaerolineae bacterium]